MEDTLTVLFTLVDDFCKEFMPEYEKHLLTNGLKKRNKRGNLSVSKIMTICIYFHQTESLSNI